VCDAEVLYDESDVVFQLCGCMMQVDSKLSWEGFNWCLGVGSNLGSP